MKNRRSKKKKNPKDNSGSIDIESPHTLKRNSFGDPFKIPCHQVDKIIDSSPMEETDRSELKNGLLSFYEALKLLLNDIENAKTQTEDQESTVNFIQLMQGWNAYKTDLVNSLKSPKRTDYINFVHNELLKIAVSVDRLLDHPPITPEFRVHGPKLTELLSTQTTNILKMFRKLFDHLLADDQVKIEIIDAARNPLRKLRQELKTKYKFFFLEDKDKPNELYSIFLKYFDRVLKKTQHFSVSHSDEIPIPIQQIDKSLTQLQQLIANPGLQDENDPKALFNLDFTNDSASYIRNNLQMQFDATSSATGLSIYNFNLHVSDGYSQVTGLENFLKNNVSYAGDDQRSIVTSMRDKARLTAKWYKMPLFETLDLTIKKLDERAAMIAARFTEDNIDKQSDFDDLYGEKEELEKQIENALKWTDQSKERLSKQKQKLSSLQRSIDEMMKDFFPNLKTSSNTPLNNLKIDFSNENDAIYQFQKLKSYISKRMNELTFEKEELIEADVIQKTTGSSMFDDEIAITQSIIKQHELMLQQIKELRIENLRIKAENEEIEKENFEKQGQCNDISEKIDILDVKITKLKTKFLKRNKKIEWLSGEVKRLKFENEHMNEIEQKNKEKFEAKIAEINEETKKLTKLSYRLPQVLQDSINKNAEMENVVIPDLSYKIEKLAGILKYQKRQAMIIKQKTKNLQIHALSKEVNRVFKAQKQEDINTD